VTNIYEGWWSWFRGRRGLQRLAFFFFETRLQRLARVTKRGATQLGEEVFVYLPFNYFFTLKTKTTTRFSKIEISIS
jgi:hypothetical protein